MPKYNPFKPGSIISPGMFTGRFEELTQLEEILFQTKNQNPAHFLIHGERGIGKSSLLFYLQSLASGKIKSFEGERFNFLTLSMDLEPETSYSIMIQRIGNELRKTVSSHQKLKDKFNTVFSFLARWEVMGVKYNSSKEAIANHELLDELVDSFADASASLSTDFDGILLLIDEVDKPEYTCHLGEFIKLFTERLTKKGINNVSIGLFGISSVIKNLKMSHESSLRVLQMLLLETLLPDERIRVINRAMEEAAPKNGAKCTFTEPALRWISDYSQGYPHFIQQFGFCAFQRDNDNEVDLKDVEQGAYEENGAFHQLGQKYFHDLYFEQIGSDQYRAVLQEMANHSDDWVSKSDISKATKLKSHILTNAIAALKKRNIILPKPGNSGIYRLPSKAFAAWISAFTQGRIKQ